MISPQSSYIIYETYCKFLSSGSVGIYCHFWYYYADGVTPKRVIPIEVEEMFFLYNPMKHKV